MNAGAIDAPADPLLARLAELSAYGALDGPTAARVLGRPLDDPAALIDHVGVQLGTDDTMVAASVAFQAVTSRVAVPVVVANQVLGRFLAAPFEVLRWRVVDRQIRLGLTDLVEGPPLPWAELVDGFVHHTVEPWVEAMRSSVTIARRLLWGNAADSLVGAARPGPRPRGPAIRPAWAGGCGPPGTARRRPHDRRCRGRAPAQDLLPDRQGAGLRPLLAVQPARCLRGERAAIRAMRTAR